jgi:hypothetical protein
MGLMGSNPTAPTNLLHFTAFVFGFDTISPLTPIKLSHCKQFNPRRTIFNCQLDIGPALRAA